jgi:hypothetical protein
MSTEVWRRMAGHSLVVVAWFLWQGVAPMVPNAPTEGAVVLKSFDTHEACLASAITKRNARNALVRRGQPAIEVFACAPAGAPPGKLVFE